MILLKKPISLDLRLVEKKVKMNGVMGQLWLIQVRMTLPRTCHNRQHSTEVRILNYQPSCEFGARVG